MGPRILLSGLAALLAVGCAWWALRSSQSPPPGLPAMWSGLKVVDRATGAPIEKGVWTLIGDRTRGFEEGFAQGVTPEAPSAAQLARARRVGVGAYGYEVRLLDVDALHASDGRVELERIVELAPLRVESDDEAATGTTVTLMLSLRDPAAPGSAVARWWLHRTLELTRADLPIPMGRGQSVIAVAMAGSNDHVRWPVPARLAPGRPTVIHLERTRRIVIPATRRTLPGEMRRGWLHVDPRAVGELSDERRTGLAMHSRLGGYEATGVTGGMLIQHAPLVPLTGVVQTVDGWFTLEVDAEGILLPLGDGPPPVRRLASVAVGDGPPPEGTVILPGILADDVVNVILARGWLDDDGLGLRAPAPDAWQTALLPESDWITLWHPDRGLARLRWSKDGAAVGSWMPGSIHVRRLAGSTQRAAVSVRSGCRGSPQMQSGSSRPDSMVRPLGAGPVSVLGGVPFGHVTIELIVWPAGETEPVTFQHTVQLDAESPCARFTLGPADTATFVGTGPVPVEGR